MFRDFSILILPRAEVSFSIPSYYEVFAVLGQGAYGYVAAANVRSGEETETVAVKKMSAWSHKRHERHKQQEAS